MRLRSVVFKHDPSKKELEDAQWMMWFFHGLFGIRLRPVYFGSLQVGWGIDRD